MGLQLVEMQVEGSYETREWSMVQYLRKVKEMMARFDKCNIQQVPKEKNVRADSLSKFGATLEGVSSRKIAVMIKEMIGNEELELKETCPIEEEYSWNTDIMRYLTKGELPSDPVEAKRLKFRACSFTMLQGKLYKRTTEWLLLKCLSAERAQYVMREIHEGSCGNHSGGRSLVQKMVRQRYFWPTLVKDTMEFVRRCESYQKHAILIHTPATPMEPIKISCPFDQCGIDILGPFPTAIA